MTRAIRSLLLAILALTATMPWTASASPDPRATASVPASAPRLDADAGNARVFLEWSWVGDAREFHVFRSTDGVWDSTPFARVQGHGFRDLRVVNGTAYSYRVAAANRAGTGPLSNIATVMPLAPPDDVVAVSGDSQVTLKWHASPGATSYTVFRGRMWGPEAMRPVGTTSELTLLDAGLTNDVIYFYRVQAKSGPNESRLSEPARGKPTQPAPSTAPTGLAVNLVDGQVNLAWTAVAGASGYKIFRSSNGLWTAPPIGESHRNGYRDRTASPGVNYAYRVAAFNRGGTGPMSAPVSITPTAPPAAPTGLAAMAGNARITLNWNAVSGATSYNVYRGTATGAQNPTPVATGLTSPTWINEGLTNGTAYFFKVTALGAGGESARSTEANATPVATTAAPTGLTASAGNATVTLSWNTVTGATSYKVYRGTTSNGQSATPVAEGLTSPSFTNSGLTNGTAYFYKVTAMGAGGESPRSSEASATPVEPLATPSGLTATPGDAKVDLAWNAVSGATSYNVYRGTASGAQNATPIATGLTTPTFSNTGLTNGTAYFYKVTAVRTGTESARSNEANATPAAALTAPTGLTAMPGNAMVTLSWTPVAGATAYSVYRGTSAGGQAATPIATGITTTAFVDSPLTNGLTYFYKVTATRSGEQSPRSGEASATPVAPVPAPTGVSATPGNATVTVAWLAVGDATSYNVYRGTTAGGEGSTPFATGLLTPSFVDTSVTNGVTYFYQVTAFRMTTQSARSAEVSATPTAVGPLSSSTLETFRFLRQATWGPKPGDVAALAPLGAVGRDQFITQQLAAPASSYPDILFGVELEVAQEHFMSLTLTGQDQLRQRMAWALHKIWVASATEVPDSRAIVTYQRIFLNGAFGNYRDLMLNVTLNPAMGRYLNMLNNKSVAKTGFPANENYAREVMQLFTLGLVQLNQNGTPTNPAAPVPTYTEDDVKALARIMTGFTYGDGLPGTIPGNSGGSQNFGVPMEAVSVAAGWHDITQKTFLGQTFDPNGTALAELNRALDIIFSQPTLAPFVSKQLIQQLVTSNPSPAYVQAVANVFNDNGGGVKGDLAAVVRAILTHPEALASSDPNTMGGKLSEPVLFISSTMRAFNATVSDHPFMTDRSEVMGQRVFYPPSVFSYFSPGFKVRGTNNGSGIPLSGPEFQGLTTVTALERANFIGALLRGDFNSWVTIDYSPFTTRANDINALVDFVVETFLGGRISPQHRNAIISGVTASGTDPFERSRTAIYLVLTTAQAQVDR